MSKRGGFTLIELVVVLVVIAVLATLATVSLSSTFDQARLTRAIEVVERADAKARRTAVSQDRPVELKFDQQKGEILLDLAVDGETFQLPSGVKLEAIRAGRRRVLGGGFKTWVNRHGRAVTYAVKLVRGTRVQWIVVLGLTGQTFVTSEDADLDGLMIPSSRAEA